MSNYLQIHVYQHPSKMTGGNFQGQPGIDLEWQKIPISINCKPGDKDLQKMSFMVRAVETMIHYNCFIENNPMRRELDDHLIWDWAIMNVGGFIFPAPIHVCSETEAILYSYSGDEIILSQEECACTTAIFYLEHFMAMVMQWSVLKKKFSPDAVLQLIPMVSTLRDMDPVNYENVINKLKSMLSENGHKVLN